MTKTNEYYVKLASSSKIVGVWDDHDFGSNNAGKEFSLKD